MKKTSTADAGVETCIESPYRIQSALRSTCKVPCFLEVEEASASESVPKRGEEDASVGVAEAVENGESQNHSQKIWSESENAAGTLVGLFLYPRIAGDYEDVVVVPSY